VGICVTQGNQLFPGHSTAHAALAMKQQYFVFVLHAAREGGLNLVQGKVDGSLQMAGAELGRAAHVHHHDSFPFRQPRSYFFVSCSVRMASINVVSRSRGILPWHRSNSRRHFVCGFQVGWSAGPRHKPAPLLRLPRQPAPPVHQADCERTLSLRIRKQFHAQCTEIQSLAPSPYKRPSRVSPYSQTTRLSTNRKPVKRTAQLVPVWNRPPQSRNRTPVTFWGLHFGVHRV